MRNLPSSTILLLTCLLICIGLSSIASADCDNSFVSFANGSAVVAPTGNDDTENIQCAFDESKVNNLQRVQLIAGEYFVSELEVSEFRGTFQGNTQSRTSISWIAESLDCSALRAAQRKPEMIRFRGGQPRLRYMTIVDQDPCPNSSGRTDRTLIRASGAVLPQCRPQIVRLEVDRVRFFSNVSAGSRPLAISAETVQKCSPLTGGLSVQYSTFTGVRGVQSALEGFSPVNVRANQFNDTTIGVEVGVRSQDTSVVNNRFFMRAYAKEDQQFGSRGPSFPIGVVVRDLPRNSADHRNSVRVANNIFIANNAGIAVYTTTDRFTRNARRSMQITDNQFVARISAPVIAENRIRFMRIAGGSDAFVAGNTVNADVSRVIESNDAFAGRPLENWIFANNDFGGGLVSWNLSTPDSGMGNTFLPDQNGFLCAVAITLCEPDAI